MIQVVKFAKANTPSHELEHILDTEKVNAAMIELHYDGEKLTYDKIPAQKFTDYLDKIKKIVFLKIKIRRGFPVEPGDLNYLTEELSYIMPLVEQICLTGLGASQLSEIRRRIEDMDILDGRKLSIASFYQLNNDQLKRGDFSYAYLNRLGDSKESDAMASAITKIDYGINTIVDWCMNYEEIATPQMEEVIKKRGNSPNLYLFKNPKMKIR